MKLIALIGSKVRIHLPIENKEYVSDTPITVTFDGGAVILTVDTSKPGKPSAENVVLLSAFAPSEWKRVEILK